MGYNTQVLILNDALGNIEANPEEFVQRLVSTIHRSVRGDVDHLDVGVAGHANAATVIPTAHADFTRVLVSHGNWLWEVKATGPTFERALREEYMRDELLNRCHQAGSAAQLVREALTR